MSRWLRRALADIGTPASVPIAPLAPIGPPAQAIGTIGSNGTGPAMAEDWQAHYEERAAIRQFDGELSKREAIAPLAPIGPPAQAIGTIGSNGTGPAMAEDWQAHYEERAAIRQFDGELSKREAIAPLAPIGPPAQAIGTIGSNGTGPAMAEDWQAHYDERAAIRQFDGELSKREAIAPLAPIGPPAQAIGTIGSNGTGPAMAEDWQAHYEERAAIRQFDGELSKREAIAPLAQIGP